jgi:hypothetical protein
MQFQGENEELLAKINAGIDSGVVVNNAPETSEESSKQEDDRGFFGAVVDGAKAVGGAIADGASWTWEGTKTVGGAVADGAVWTGGKIADGAVWTGEKIADGASATWEGTKIVGGAVADGAVWTGGKIADGGVWVYDKTTGLFSCSDETSADRLTKQAQEEFTSLQEQWETLKRETATNNITTGFWSRVFVTKTKVNAEIDRMNKSGEMDELWKGFHKEHEKDFAAIGACLNASDEKVESSTKADNTAAVGKPMTEVLANSSSPGVQNIETETKNPNGKKGTLPLNIKGSSGR